MNWKLKAKIQNLVNSLPPSLSYPIYYWMQRNVGGLREDNLNPMSGLEAGIATCKRIEKIGRSFVGATFLEVGTGRRINTPLAFWLLGAERVITVDLNPYLKEELVKNDLDFIQKNKIEIQKLFEGRIFNDRLNSLLNFISSEYNLVNLLKFIDI